MTERERLAELARVRAELAQAEEVLARLADDDEHDPALAVRAAWLRAWEAELSHPADESRG